MPRLGIGKLSVVERVLCWFERVEVGVGKEGLGWEKNQVGRITG